MKKPCGSVSSLNHGTVERAAGAPRHSWDDSSSVSSGISDTFDADDIAGSSVPCRDLHLEGGKLRTDTEKQVVRHSDLSGSDSGVKMESGSKWGCRQPSDHSDESERSSSERKTPTIGHTGSWRRGMSAQVGVTSPRTKPSNASSSSSSTLPSTSKTLGTGKTDDAKVSERGGLSPGSRSNGLQRSPSSGVDEPRKPSCGSGSSSARTPTSTFGFKKHSAAGGAGGGGSLMTLVTASGGTITSGSATLGKIPRSSLTGSLQYSNGAGPGRALSRQASVDDGYLSANGKHSALQYRSLPRPSRSSGGHTGIGTNGRSGAARGSMAGVDVSLGARAATIHGSKRNGVSRASLGANQTDREKGVAVESCAQGEVHSAGMPAGSLPPSGPRQAGGKYPDVSSPTLRRLFGGAKSAKQAPLAGPDGMKSSVVLSNPHAGPGHQGSALHSPSPSASSGASSPLYGGGRVAGLGVELGLSPLASSPGSALSTPSHSLAWSSGYPSPGYPSPGCFPSSLGSLATSSESMDVSLGSVGGGGGGPGLGGVSREDTALQTRANGVKAGYSDRYAHLSPLRGEEPRDWLRSHSTGGVQESAACSPFSPSSSLSSPSGTRYNFTQLAGSPTTAANQMSLANLRVSAVAVSGLAPQDGGEAYSDARLRNSNMSLEEKSRTISTSGSFRDGLEEVHGSSLSLVSSTSSVYSTPEEKSQSEIRKLRRELEASQEKVSALTTQLSANAHLVAAFEQSLSNMTIRLHSLTTTAEQKDGELNTLKKTIDSLKRQHSVTQAAINTAINTPETCAQDPNSPVSGQASPVSPLSEACIRRQPSSDSMASLTSQTSHSSLGSANDLHSNGSKKKQKKNWLRSSFKQAFGKKKSSKASSQSDMEDSLADLSLPSSPQLSYQPRHQATSPKSSYQHHPSSPTSPGLRSSHSNSLISECVTDGASDAETVMQLRSELRDKEMKLTDIRLEALSSAHQLDTLREAMSRMQGEMDALKQENSQLRVEAQQQSQPLGQPQQAQPRLQDSSNSSSRVGPPPSVISPTLGQTAPSLTHTESTSLDMLLEDSGDSGSRKDGRHVKVVVTLDPSNNWTEECRPRQFLIGCIGVSGKTRWDVLDGVVRRLFKEYIIHVDPSSQLGLNSDSVLGYSIGEIQRRAGTHTPELLPCGYLVGHSNTISVSLKDSTCHSEDSLVFETLIPRPIVQRYISQLQEHRRIILSGPSGTGKSYLASRLAEHMVQREGLEVTPGVIATFNVDHESSKELRQYLCNLADQFSQTADMLPLVVILENLHHLPSLTDLFNGLLHGKNHRCPYIIGTMIQASSSTPNLQLHQNFRWVLCSHHVEPVKGFLGRFLRRTLLETEMSSRCRSAELVKVVEWLPSVWQHLNRFLERHSSPDVAIGPRLFLSCPMAVEASRVWFTDLWNYSLIPYLLEAVREGLQLYGRRAEWDNPTSWVLDSFPWSSSPAHPDWPPLLQLRPEDVGFHGYPITRDGCADTNTIQTDTDTDPLMNMLLRLKEAAHTPVPQSSYHSNATQPSPESSL